jgi:tripartite-type tricarboxylate transporter receptor subunit TctC
MSQVAAASVTLKAWVLLFVSLCVASPQALARDDAFPNRPVRLVVPFGPGGPTDVMARLFAGEMAKALQQPVVIENKPGAGGNIGIEHVVRSPADGYTIVLGTAATTIINPMLSVSLPYNPLTDLVPVAQFAQVPNVLVVNPDVPAKDFAEFAAILKKKSGTLNYGSGGTGTTAHLQGEVLKAALGIDAVHVPYKGEAPAIIDLLGGSIQYTFAGMASSLQQIRAGKVRPLAIAALARSDVLPGVPTFTEVGVKGLELSAWYGLLAPKGTPPDVIRKLNDAVREAFKSATLTARLADLGAAAFDLTPQEFAQFLRAEAAKWGPVVKASGARAE